MMCKVFGISRAAFYAWKKRAEKESQDPRIEMIKQSYADSRKSYGYRRITIDIQNKYQISINHKAVLRLMRKIGIQSIARRRKPYPTSNQNGIYHKYKNVLNRDFSANRPNQKWVTDITYIRTQQGWVYLSVIKDLYDGFIVAYKLSRHQSNNLVIETIKLAKQKEKVTDGLLLHSDQGFQYTSPAYFNLLQDYKILPSMSRRGNCFDNAVIENFFGHLKQEALQQVSLPTFEEVLYIIDTYIHFYNYERIQLKSRQTPYQIRCLSS